MDTHTTVVQSELLYRHPHGWVVTGIHGIHTSKHLIEKRTRRHASILKYSYRQEHEINIMFNTAIDETIIMITIGFAGLKPGRGMMVQFG